MRQSTLVLCGCVGCVGCVEVDSSSRALDDLGRAGPAWRERKERARFGGGRGAESEQSGGEVAFGRRSDEEGVVSKEGQEVAIIGSTPTRDEPVT